MGIAKQVGSAGWNQKVAARTAAMVHRIAIVKAGHIVAIDHKQAAGRIAAAVVGSIEAAVAVHTDAAVAVHTEAAVVGRTGVAVAVRTRAWVAAVTPWASHTAAEVEMAVPFVAGQKAEARRQVGSHISCMGRWDQSKRSFVKSLGSRTLQQELH